MPFFDNHGLKEVLASQAVIDIMRKEHQSRTVFPVGRQVEIRLRADLFKEIMGHLHENPGPISSVDFTSACAPMTQIHQHRQRLGDNLM